MPIKNGNDGVSREKVEILIVDEPDEIVQQSLKDKTEEKGQEGH